MPDRLDPRLVVEFERLGRFESNSEDYAIETSYLTSSDSFEFTLYHPDRSRLLGLELEPVNLLIDGNSQLLGTIEVTSVGDEGSAVQCTGRDYMSSLAECRVDPSLSIKKEMSLFEALTLAAQPVGIDTVVSDDDVAMRNIRTGRSFPDVPRLEFHNLKPEDWKANPNEGILDFCDRLVSRHGATIQPGPNRRTLVLSAPNYNQDPVASITRTDDNISSGANNVIQSRARRDYSKFPTYTLFQAKHGALGNPKRDLSQRFDMTVLAAEFGGEIARTLDGKVVSGRRRPGQSDALALGQIYRLLYLRDEESRTAEQVERAAMRAISERLKDTLSYTVTLQGHDDPRTGAVWAVNTMVQVRDDICGINEALWIESRSFRYDRSRGPTTELRCWRPSSFTL